MLVGLLVGYNLQPGGEWKGEFAIVPLTGFSSLSLAHDATHPRTHPQLIKEAKQFDKTFAFPLQATYKEHNGTLEGIKRAAVISGESPSAAPLASPFDVPSEDAIEEPCVGHAYSSSEGYALAKTTFVEDKTREDDETSVGTGGSTTDDGDQESGPTKTRGRKTTRPPYIDTDWWKSMQWVDRKKIAKQYIEMCAEDVAKKMAALAPGEAPNTGGSSASGLGPAAAVAMWPWLCIDPSSGVSRVRS
jgi:hypothetical protein